MQLIKVENTTIGNDVKQTVSARELHAFLEVGKDFTTWMKVQIERARLVENRDFVVFTQKGENLKGGRPSAEYYLTIDAGKHVSMMSGTDKGFEVRDYFLECERTAKDPVALLNDPSMLKQLLLANLQTVEDQKLQIEQRDKLIAVTAPKAAVADRIASADGWFCLRDAAKILKIAERKFIDWLLIKKWLYRDMKGKLRGYSDKTPTYINHKVTPIPVDGDQDRVSLQPMVTAEGLAKLARIFNVETEGVFA